MVFNPLIPSGIYSLRNVEHMAFALCKSSTDDEPVVSMTLPVGAASDTDIGHKWTVTSNEDGTCTIANKLHGVFAWTSIGSHEVQSTRNNRHGEGAWFISRPTGAPGFRISSVSDQSCWSLGGKARYTPIEAAEATSSKRMLWIFENDSGQYPNDSLTNLTREDPESPYDPAKGVILYDFQSEMEPTDKLDVVIVLIENEYEVNDETGVILRGLSTVLNRLVKANSLRLDVRFGAIALAKHDDASWSLSWSSFVSQSSINASGNYDYEESSSRSCSVKMAVEKAINMPWRDDAAKVIIISPRIEPPPPPGIDADDVEGQSLDELIGAVREASMLLAFDTSRQLLSRYMRPESFFLKLGIMAPPETVSLPEKHLVNWMLASALYKNDIKIMVKLFHVLDAKLWSASDYKRQQIVRSSTGPSSSGGSKRTRPHPGPPSRSNPSSHSYDGFSGRSQFGDYPGRQSLGNFEWSDPYFSPGSDGMVPDGGWQPWVAPGRSMQHGYIPPAEPRPGFWQGGFCPIGFSQSGFSLVGPSRSFASQTGFLQRRGKEAAVETSTSNPSSADRKSDSDKNALAAASSSDKALSNVDIAIDADNTLDQIIYRSNRDKW